MTKLLRPIVFSASFFTIVLLALGCQPAPESGSGFKYASGSTIPIDAKVYTITGEVAEDVRSIVRQTAPAVARVSSSNGVTYGTYYGPEMKGKGLVRVFVHYSNSDFAPSETIAILKVEDTKGIALLPGDIVTFKCRIQFEALSATTGSQVFQEDAGVWEFDYCRLDPVIRVSRVITHE